MTAMLCHYHQMTAIDIRTMPRGSVLGIVLLFASLFSPQNVLALASGPRSPWSVLPIYGGGYVQNVCIAPSATNIWYTYVDVGGPYRSDDAGRHWRPLHGNLTVEQRMENADHVRTLSVDPRDADNIVICAGNSFDRPGGIYVSRDGGMTFKLRQKARFYGNGQRRIYGLCLARNPNNADELIAGEDWDGLFRSTDNGETWTKVGPEEHWFSDIRYDRVIPGRVYALAPPIADTPGVRQSTVRKSGFWRSEDSGVTWRKLSDDSPAEMIQMAGNTSLVGVFGPRSSRVMISKDGGGQWEPFGQGLPMDDAQKPYYFAGFYAFATADHVWIVGHAEGDIYARRATDSSWVKVKRERMSLGDPQCEGHLSRLLSSKRFDALGSIAIDESNVRHWLATDWYAIWESHDAGRTWTARVNGMMQLVSNTIAFDPFSSDRIHYGVADMCYFRSLDGGKTYERPDGLIPYAHSFAFSMRTKGLMFATGGKEYTYLRRSFDGGMTWEKVETRGLPDFRAKKLGAYGVSVDPVTDDVYLSVGGVSGPDCGGVYRSNDNGANWERFSDGLPVGVELLKNNEYQDGPGDSIYFSREGSCLLATRKSGELWRLDRDGGRWVRVDVPSTEGIVGVDPSMDGRFVLCGSPMLELTDGGKSIRALEGMPHGCWSVSFDAHTRGLAVLGNQEGIWISDDGARSARILSRGLDYPSGADRRVFVDRKRLFAFSSGSGVWVRNLGEMDSRESYPIRVEDLRIRDPFIVSENDTYFLYESKPWWGGRGVNVFESKDLMRWSVKKPVMELPAQLECAAVWAPEVHRFKDRWYLFVTVTMKPESWRIAPMPTDGFKLGTLQPRGVWIFRADSPRGPFLPLSDGSVTPRDWMCLDGTFYEESGKPYMVFCHEWCQVGDGRMMLAELSPDLSRFVGEPTELFRASSVGKSYIVTDGPFLHRSAKNGCLYLLWSNFGKGGYSVYLKRSETGSVKGPWRDDGRLFAGNGGHGMAFRDFNGKLRFVLHQPDTSPNERMKIFKLCETTTGLTLE